MGPGIEIVNKDSEGKIKQEYKKEDGKILVDSTDDEKVIIK